ncbi:hypothetical protein LIER_26466 [Lithospermum erythrorhizon]|uniref:Tropomyosin n=1 Tax=Lithospermum erythrorhizon TaxID=34254 RepID=A0AAV3R8G6_LITER
MQYPLSSRSIKCCGSRNMELEHVKRCSTLEEDLEKLRSDQASLAKEVEDSRSMVVEATKRAEDAETRALKAETLLKQADAMADRNVAEFKESEERDLLVGTESTVAVTGFVNKFQSEFP